MPLRSGLAFFVAATAPAFTTATKTFLLTTEYTSTNCSAAYKKRTYWSRGAAKEDTCRVDGYPAGVMGATSGNGSSAALACPTGGNLTYKTYPNADCSGSPTSTDTGGDCKVQGGIESKKHECKSVKYFVQLVYKDAACTTLNDGTKPGSYNIIDFCEMKTATSSSKVTLSGTKITHNDYTTPDCSGTATTGAFEQTCNGCDKYAGATPALYVKAVQGACVSGSADQTVATVTGSLSFDSADCAKFQATSGKEALQKTIAKTAGLKGANDYKLVTVTVSCTRRLSEEERRLATQKTKVDYDIKVKAGSVVSSSEVKAFMKGATPAAVTATLQSELSTASITATVASMTKTDPKEKKATASAAAPLAPFAGLATLLAVLARPTR